MPLITIGARRSLLAAPAIVAAAAWTPASLGSALIAWYKADAGVYKDAGTTLAANNETVQQWNDQSGNGYHLKQASSFLRGTYKTAILNSLPVIDFDGSGAGNWLQTTSQPVTLGVATVSVFMVRQITSANGVSSCRVAGISTPGSSDLGNDTFIAEYCPGTAITTPTTYNNGNKSNGSVSSGTWNQLGTIFDGSNNIMYIANTAQSGVADTHTFAASVDIEVFADGGGNSNPSGQLAELIFTNTAMSLSDRNSLATYFTSRWGI
jgi:hypothetical protein